MKKIVSILSMVATTTLLHAQGTVIFTSANLGVLTNTATSHFAGGTEQAGVSGKTSTANAGAFIYQLFDQTYTGALSTSATNPLANGWTVATSSGAPITGTNGIAGPQAGSILNGTVAIDGLAAPTGGTYDTAGRDYFMIVGWSSNLGTTWATVSSLLAGNFAANTVVGAFFGTSIIGNAYGAGTPLSPQSIFITSGQTLTPITAFSLYSIPVVSAPEPTTMALAGLGGLSLLLFRRRK